MKNKRIDTYETPYCIDLVVANKEVTIEDLKELYTYSNGDELDNGIVEDKNGYKFQASCSMCKRKSDNHPVVLILLIKETDIKKDKLLDLINTASHEAAHAILDIYSFTGAEVDYNNQEMFAYNLAWFTEKIMKTWLNK